MHKHRAKRTTDWGYSAPVGPTDRQNPSAHGGVTEVAECSCGAIRRTNVNGNHVERGEWHLPPSRIERRTEGREDYDV